MEGAIDRLLTSEKFKCSKCKNHLSVAPILALEHDKYACGRCNDFIYAENSNPKIERQTLYEEIARTLSFPCRNKTEGCQQILPWSEIEEHEKTCQFGKIGCIFNAEEFTPDQQCKWRGTSEEYFKHLEEHAEAVDNVEKLEIWKNPKNQVISIELFNNILLVILLFLNNAYHFVMIGKDKKDTINYKFTVSDEKEDNFCCFSHSSIYLPLTLQEILKYKLNFCSKFIEPKFFSINLLGTSACACQAEILPYCKSCSKIIKDEIFNCGNDCKYCGKCTELSDYYCPSCHHDDQDSYQSRRVCYISNNSFRQECSIKHYKCENEGCSFHGTIYELQRHGEFCKLIIDKYSKVLKLNVPYEMKESEYFFSFDEAIFKLLKTESKKYIRLKLFSMKTTKVKYKFEISLSNSSFTLMSFAIFPNFDHLKSNAKKLTVIPRKVLNQYASNNIKFKLNISRI